MTNPYKSPTLNVEAAKRLSPQEPSAQRFWITHFITFAISFPIFYIVMLSVSQGFSETLSNISHAPPRDLFVIAAMGFCVWFAHLCFAMAYPPMRRCSAGLSAVVGCVFFFIGPIAYTPCQRLLPNVTEFLMSLPIYINAALLIVSSLSAVWLLVLLSTDRPRTEG